MRIYRSVGFFALDLSDAKQGEDLPQIAACKCHFFDGCGDLRKDRENGGDEHWINEVLRRRFLRLGM